MKIERNETVTPTQVLAAVAEHFRILPDALLRHDRAQPISRWRQLAMYLIREICGASYPEIARVINRADHTTVMYGCRVIERLLDDGDSMRDHAYRIVESLRSLSPPPPAPPASEDSIGVPSPYADSQALYSLVVRFVSLELVVSKDAIESRSHQPEAVMGRMVAMYLLREVTGWSLMDIGRSFGRDHTTVMSALQRIETHIASSRELHALVIRLASQLPRIPRFRELAELSVR